ncbi:MAG: hypothetical protein ACT4P7_23375 [Gemmatimonadaceae bacterium]
MRASSRLLTLFAGAVSMTAFAWFADDPRLTGRLDERTREAVSAVIESARKEGLPTEPLVDKALEGASKQAAGPTIVTVVRGLVGDLRRAKGALGPASTLVDIEAGANALRAGVNLRELERLRVARTNVRVATALDIVSYLVNRGVPADTIAPRVVTLVLAGSSNDQLLTMRQEIERDISGGVAAATAASLRGIGLEQQLRERPNNSGGPGSTLPSVRGQSRVADPLAPSAVSGSKGNASVSGPGDGAGPAGPRGKPKPKRP